MKKILLTLVFTGVLLFIFAVPRNLVVVEISTGTPVYLLSKGR